ncbi:MAG TPA: hypothetical protein VH988_07655 [Thermoanaerobaculia bacterium]|jgi:hypothetical protein|nr:hypothetical protein [Thermoanaerobaculia bacterium]
MSDRREPLDIDVRRRLEQYVKPLYAGLDGVQTFDRVGRLRSHVAVLREETAEIDEPLLEILLLLHGVVDRLGSLAAGGRLDLFLKGLGLPEELIRAARAGTGRCHDDPRRPEEELLHDALLLESTGVVATVERLLAAGKKRVALARALAQLDPGPAAERYRTARGAALGAARRKAAEEWIEDLRRRAAQEGA